MGEMLIRPAPPRANLAKLDKAGSRPRDAALTAWLFDPANEAREARNGGNGKVNTMTDEQSPTDPCEPDPLVGEEIMRVSMESWGVFIHTDGSQVQIGSEFFVRRIGRDDCWISPQGKVGEVSALWPSLGSRIAAVAWGRDLVLTLDDGTEIVVPPSPSGYRGAILSHDGKNTTWDDF